MSISDERIERAAKACAARHKGCVRRFAGKIRCPLGNDEDCDCLQSARAALEADAPAIAEAKIEGMREIMEMISAQRKAFRDRSEVAWPLIELGKHASARISSLEAEMKEGGK